MEFRHVVLVFQNLIPATAAVATAEAEATAANINLDASATPAEFEMPRVHVFFQATARKPITTTIMTETPPSLQLSWNPQFILPNL